MNNTENKPKEDVVVPCKAECPAHTDVPRYIRFVKEGNYDAAAAVIREKAPFPECLGHVCTHTCELEVQARGRYRTPWRSVTSSGMRQPATPGSTGGEKGSSLGIPGRRSAWWAEGLPG